MAAVRASRRAPHATGTSRRRKPSNPTPISAAAIAVSASSGATVSSVAGSSGMWLRAFACVLAEDRGRLTAGELVERLHVSPAAISGAVRYLTQAGMLVRAREPGERRDHYAVHDDVWTDMCTTRMALLRRWEHALAEGIDMIGAERPAGRRLAETREFLAFLQSEVPDMLRRWEEHKAARL
jgi:DNA-binding transcriptional ArsR family regulator